MAPMSNIQIKRLMRSSQNRGINNNKEILNIMATPLTSNKIAKLECRSVIRMMSPVTNVAHSQGSRIISD